MAYLTHLCALFSGVALGFFLCCLFASRLRERSLDEVDDEELMARLTGDDKPHYYDQTPSPKKGAQ